MHTLFMYTLICGKGKNMDENTVFQFWQEVLVEMKEKNRIGEGYTEDFNYL